MIQPKFRESKLLLIVAWITTVIFFIVIVPLALCLLFGRPLADVVYNRYAGSVVGLSLLSVVAALAAAAVWRVKRPKLRLRLVYAGLALLAVATELVMAHALLSSGQPWDAGTVSTIAQNYVSHGTTFTHDWNGLYLAKYDNNISITLLLAIIYKLAGHLFGPHYSAYAQAFNSVVILASLFLTVFVVKRLYGHRAALVSYVFGYVLILLSPYAAITYSDTLGMFFVIAIITSAVMARQTIHRQRLTWLALFGVLTAGGYFIKPTVIFVSLSLVLLFLIQRTVFNKEVVRHYYRPALAVIVGLLIGWASYHAAWRATPNFAVYTPAQLNANRTPLQHYLAMGSFRGLPPYAQCSAGGFCAAFVAYEQSNSANVNTVAKRKAYSVSLWERSVKADFPAGYSSLLAKKALLSYSDGSFGTWQEGGDRNKQIVFHFSGRFDKAVRSVMGPFGSKADTLRRLQQVVWLAVLLIISAGVVRVFRDRNFSNDIWQNGFRLSALGITAFLAVFESRARYLFLYVPVFILLAVGTLATRRTTQR